MIRQLWTLSVHTRTFLRRYMPTNLLLDIIRTRRGLKWGIPTMFLSVPYLLAAGTLTTVIAEGGPGWLNLLVFICFWNAIKLIIMGPVSLVLLIRARIRAAFTSSTGQPESNGLIAHSPRSLPK
ncbi:sulfate permease [Leucobacter chromiireducens]|uniref:sulfate permease n=1 Tax=Leucobacter chromiireducens TaxID=283877 RepID=UPI001F163FDC|nr:sulfate permease [Leucobacter chromiireducens]